MGVDVEVNVLAELKTHRVLANALLGQALWFVGVLGGVRHLAWPVLGVVLLLVGVQLLLQDEKRLRLLLHISLVAGLGIFLDTLLITFHVFDPVRSVVPTPWCPLWLAALWVNFASMTGICLRRLGERPILSVLAGAVGGPLAYAGGLRFHALTFPRGNVLSLAVLAVTWAFTAWFALVILPTLLTPAGERGPRREGVQ